MEESSEKIARNLANYAYKILEFILVNNLNKRELSKDWEIEIELIDQDYSSHLNETYKGRQGPASILTFDLSDEFSNVTSIALCPSYIENSIKNEQIPENELWDLKDELYWLVTHAVLHIAGYSHSTEDAWIEMIELQKKIMKEVYGKTKWWVK